ncbi:hypothetical protein OsccyDRAFT_4719 [Leptolyngbyaceae cyanobacterium JSC-12]|nr:hypothetical protein OsccyDRAFT_4719 [Leptolyngbyaceae cyanobacterium JSC-12]
MKVFAIAIASGFSIATVLGVPPESAQAQFPQPGRGCQYLREVTTRQTQIRKVVATNNSNANTDFVVPTGVAFTNYLGLMIPENNERYTAEVNLKYPDNSSSTVVNRTIQARRFYLYQLTFRTPTQQQPFQVNARITGNRNTAYRIAVQACQ